MAQDMHFKLESIDVPVHCTTQCTEVIAAQGEIVPDTPHVFVQFLARHVHDRRIRTVLLLNSPGGTVQSSIVLGRLLRKLRFVTVVGQAQSTGWGSTKVGIVSGRCYSACVYTFMGGFKRVIPPGSEAGIHRAYIPAVGPDPVGSVMASGSREPRASINPDLSAGAIARFSAQMGISLGLLKQAQSVPPTSIHIITPLEAARWHLASQKF
ncbi:MAG: hypothetical protein KGQ46_07510 [Hyphomicrobiales bacterium]|nr:hypothetical protein [Hyphomicrobiales bacterium]MDE2114052.1 hypothetical protein [Hyphomicrobiales bacterium]